MSRPISTVWVKIERKKDGWWLNVHNHRDIQLEVGKQMNQLKSHLTLIPEMLNEKLGDKSPLRSFDAEQEARPKDEEAERTNVVDISTTKEVETSGNWPPDVS